MSQTLAGCWDQPRPLPAPCCLLVFLTDLPTPHPNSLGPWEMAELTGWAQGPAVAYLLLCPFPDLALSSHLQILEISRPLSQAHSLLRACLVITRGPSNGGALHDLVTRGMHAGPWGRLMAAGSASTPCCSRSCVWGQPWGHQTAGRPRTVAVSRQRSKHPGALTALALGVPSGVCLPHSSGSCLPQGTVGCPVARRGQHAHRLRGPSFTWAQVPRTARTPRTVISG